MSALNMNVLSMVGITFIAQVGPSRKAYRKQRHGAAAKVRTFQLEPLIKVCRWPCSETGRDIADVLDTRRR